jgi:LemA protein
MVVTENYPQLKSDANFRDLQAQLEGHGEPHYGGTQSLHKDSRAIQYSRPQFSDQSDRDDVQVRSETELSPWKTKRPSLTAPKVEFGNSPAAPPAAAPAPAPAPSAPPKQ